MGNGRVSLVGAGPGDPDLWTVRALRRVQEADLVLYDALVDGAALRRLTNAQCFRVGKRAGRASVRQETIHHVMIRAARRGKRVVRLKGGDPFVFGRGGEEALALELAGVAWEVVPGLSSAIAAPALAGIPVTHRGVATGFLVVSGHAPDALDAALDGVRPNGVSLVVLMGLASRARLASSLATRGWRRDTPAAIVCAASTPSAWTWTGRLDALGAAQTPMGLPGVLVVGDVVRIREAIGADAAPEAQEVTYGIR